MRSLARAVQWVRLSGVGIIVRRKEIDQRTIHDLEAKLQHITDCRLYGRAVLRRVPDFACRTWEALECAPMVVAGPILTAVQTRLLQRSAKLARRAGTKPPNFSGCLSRLPIERQRPRARLVLAASEQDCREHRPIGLRQPAGGQCGRVWFTPRAPSPFHRHEPDQHIHWTNGSAALPDELFDGHIELVPQLTRSSRYMFD